MIPQEPAPEVVILVTRTTTLLSRPINDP